MTKVISFPDDGYAYSGAEAGEALAALIQRDADGVPREGILPSRQQLISGRSDWFVDVAPFLAVSVVDHAILLGGVSEDEQVEIEEPPVSGGRIDRVVWDGSTSSLNVIGGAPGASPVAPSIPPGLLSLGTISVEAADTSSSMASFVADFRYSATVSGVLPIRSVDDLDGWDPADGAEAKILGRKGMRYFRLNGSWIPARTVGGVSAVPGYGLSIGSGTKIERDEYGRVVAYIEIIRTGAAIPSGGPIAVVNTGFRPGSTIEIAGTSSQGGNAQSTFGQILPNGNIIAFNPGAGNRKFTVLAIYEAVV